MEFFLCPTLSHQPSVAIHTLEAIVRKITESCDRFSLIGSSLGGYYATWLAEQYAARAALINPAVKPYTLLASRLGFQRNPHTGEQYELTARHIDELEQLEVREITQPERYYLLIQSGDEILDYHEAVDKYYGARQCVIEGGDHAFQDFDSYIVDVLSFLGFLKSSDE